uniref:Novel immune-type receptor 12 n=1 Tax=Amphilophus citrinellus TaxID=61819 RepID=A0A3Q0S7H5_AMPCI
MQVFFMVNFASHLLCLSFPSAHMTDVKRPTCVHQDSSFLSCKTSDSLTLNCFYKGDVAARLYWYKQQLGQKPKLISTFYTYENSTFYGEFMNNPRFTLDTKNGKNHLMIADLQISDSATYYCMSSYLNILIFLESITVIVEDADSNVQALLLQSSSETIQPGGSVTLNCTVHTLTCGGKQSIYWFKRSEKSHPGLIYTHGGINDQCERKADTQTNTCVYNLPMNNLNVSHAGTYYCAVASCGHILFGNGTKLDFEDDAGAYFSPFWSSAFAFTSILCVLLAFTLCMMGQKCCRKSSGNWCFGFQVAEKIFVAALSVNLSNRSRSQRDHTWSECVYYSVKQ